MKVNLHLISCIIFAVFFLSANSQPKLKYSPYQILVWEIKANEGYRSWWYKDGKHWKTGKQRYSIGFGWNDCASWKRRQEIKKFTQDGKVTFNEAKDITLLEISKYKKLNKDKDLNKDPLKNLALQLYSYNCGFTNKGSSLGKCCGGTWGCGSVKSNVRKSHNRRRQFELALWNHDIRMVDYFTTINQLKAAQMERKYK